MSYSEEIIMTHPKAVLVTGASGFIGLHTTLHLLELGYAVRATVRTEAQAQSVRATLSSHVDTGRLTFALADLCQEAGWQEAAQGCDFVVHTAAPFPAANPKDENELIQPARDGTLRVLRAAQAGGIRRGVMLSTVGAVSEGHQGEHRTFDESDWSDLGKSKIVYSKSKTLAERAAWDFIHSAENKSNMEMVAVNPSAVFGPVLDSHYHTSIEWFRTIMQAEVPGVARIQLDLVDVRDLVDVLAKAMTATEAAGKRFICNAASIQLVEFAELLKQNFSGRGFRIQTGIIPDLLVRALGLFIPKIRAVAIGLGGRYSFSTEQTRAVFGWQPRPYEQTILEMAESLIKFGLVKGSTG